MATFVIIFIIIAVTFSLATMGLVIWDIIKEHAEKKDEKKPEAPKSPQNKNTH